MLDFLPTGAFTLTNLNAGKIAATTVGESISLARQNREEIRVARLTMNRTQAEREEIFARYAPTMDLQFGGDLSTGSNIDRRDSWNAGVSFSWAIFDRGQRKLDLKSNALQIEQDGLRIENAARVVSNDAVESWYGLERNRLRLASLEIERKAAEANFDVQQGKYKAGLATALEVQTALRDLARVRIESVSASFSLELSYHDLENVLALYESSRVDATLRRLTVPAPLKTNPTPQPPKP
jgi:outer membrane protein